jgi:hypothetical protein
VCYLGFKLEVARIAQSVQQRPTGWIAVKSGFDSRQGEVVFLTASRPHLGPADPPIQWVMWALSLRETRLWRESDHSNPPSAEIKIGGTIPTLPHTSSWCEA